MMMSCTWWGGCGWALAVSAGMVGMGCGQSRPTQFYLLTPAAAAAEREAAVGAPRRLVGLAPVVLPGYLDRAQIVTRTGSHGLRVSEFHRWAEPLAGAVGRTLVENLARLRPQERFVLLPWNAAAPPANRIWLEVLRFERGPGEQVHLAARWMISGSEGKEVVPLTTTEVQVPSEGPEYDATAAAMSRALGELAGVIAAGLPSEVPVP